MKIRIVLCFCALTIGVSLPGALSINDSGSFTVGDLRARFKCAAGANWRSAIQDNRQYFTVLDNRDGELESRLVMDPELRGTLRQSFRKIGDGRWSYDLEFAEDPGYEAVHVAVDMTAEADRFIGKRMAIDGEDFVFPAELARKKDPFNLLWRKCRRASFLLENSKVTFSSESEFGVLIQDDRASGGTSFAVRLVLLERGADGAYRQRFTVTEEQYAVSTLDLRAAFNASFLDDKADDRQGGWTDQGPENDLRILPYRDRHPDLGDVPFELVDPDSNHGKSCIALRGPHREYFPQSASAAIAGECRGNYLYLLHTLAWPAEGNTPKGEIGTVVIEFADGSSAAITVVGGRDAANWWLPQPLPNGVVAWSGHNRSSLVGLYRSRFRIPDRQIRAIRFEANGASVWMIVAATVASDPVPEKADGGVVHIEPGDDWRPIRLEKDVIPGGILDFSGTLDAPAGKYGPVVIRNGHFEFRDRPGTPVRFYGTNLVDTAQYLSREWSERLAERLARSGFNLVRFHHHDNGLSVRDGNGSTGLNPDRLDALNFLIACLKKRGIYIITDCYVSRTFTEPEISRWGSDDFKKLVFMDADALENWKQFVRNWLDAPNPYTGNRLKDEPALLGVTLVNEGCIGCGWNDRTCRILEKLLPALGALSPKRIFYEPAVSEAVLSLYQKGFREMRRFVSQDLGMDKPLSDRSIHAEWPMVYMRNEYGFVDNHYYFDHPKYPVNAWRLPSVQKNVSQLAFADSDMNGMFPGRLFGKPFAVTEFDYPKPNFYRAEGGVLPAAYAGLQDWDALAQFACSHGDYNILRDQTVGGPFDLYSDVVKLLSHRIGVRLFLGNEIKPAPLVLPVLFDPSHPEKMCFDMLPRRDLLRLGLIARIGSFVLPEDHGSAMPAEVRDAAAFLDAGINFPDGGQLPRNVPVVRADCAGGQLFEELRARGILMEECAEAVSRQIYRAAGGQLEFDAGRQIFKAAGNGVNVLILPAGSSGSAGRLAVDNQYGRGVFSLQSADGRPLESSERILFLHLTDTEATRLKFDNKSMTQCSSYGKPPHLAARGEAQVRLRLDGDFTLHSCDTAGKRLAEVPVQRGDDGMIQFQARVFRPEGSIFVYELVRNK